jgi:hypothetical protein
MAIAASVTSVARCPAIRDASLVNQNRQLTVAFSPLKRLILGAISFAEVRGCFMRAPQGSRAYFVKM